MVLKPGNTLSVEQFWETVKKAGHSPRDTRVEVRGEVASQSGGLVFTVSGQKLGYELVAGAETLPGQMLKAQALAGPAIRLEAFLSPPKTTKTRAALRLVRVIE